MLMERWLDAAGITDLELRRCYVASHYRLRAVTTPQQAVLSHLFRDVPVAIRPHGVALASPLLVADDLVDNSVDGDRRRRLDVWVERVIAAITAGHSDDPVLHATAHTFAVWGLRIAYLEEAFEAMRRDIMFEPFATHEELERWARAMTGAPCALLAAMMEDSGIPGILEEHEPTVRKLAGVLQMTDNLYDFAEDLQRGRLYLPLEDLDRFGVTQDELLQGRWSPAVAELLAFEVARERSALQEMIQVECPRPWVRLMDSQRRLGILMLDEVIADGPLILRRIPPIRVQRWLTALFPEGIPGGTAQDEASPLRATGLGPRLASNSLEER